MICRIWHGWTSPANADAYDHYLQCELFPRLKTELGTRGYRGFHLLRSTTGDEVEFVTMLWFDSIASVQAFAGESFKKPVISGKAKTLLSRFADCVDHYELSGSSFTGWDRFAPLAK
jgi:heme-degrading monooxygenase HmoA